MKNPIIVTGDGDIRVFHTPESAFRGLELIDIENNEYVPYDSEGQLLWFEVVRKELSKKQLGFFTFGRNSVDVFLREYDPPIHKADELRSEIIRFFSNPHLKHLGYSFEGLSILSLDDLIEIAAKHWPYP